MTTDAPTAPSDGPTAGSPSADLSSFPDRDEVEAALVEGEPGEVDPTPPQTAFFASLVPGQPEVLSDERAAAGGTVSLRVACTTRSGGDVMIDLALADGTPVTDYPAPCGAVTATGHSIATSRTPALEVDGPYTVTVVAEEDAVVGVGLVDVG
ncbi:hypothetical protein [Actinotalea sp. K2]|uniref:hypothetical protein n=1 Tax=Actinotalea sp. K2 TaxID=2939438 RepID=UPI00201798A8|nr:hypothetical protein [Actinotalea sp. K2]MCL3860984.1 hypothetical protein [Actinotalea sp. K2]